MGKVAGVVLAAGLGTRMAPMPGGTKCRQKKTPPSKQFTELGGTPILIHTLRKFAAVEAVSACLDRIARLDGKLVRWRLKSLIEWAQFTQVA